MREAVNRERKQKEDAEGGRRRRTQDCRTGT